MRRELVATVKGTALLVLLLGAPPAARADDCLLGLPEGGAPESLWRRCDFKRDDGFAGSYCTQFQRGPAGTEAENRFGMGFPGGTVLACGCKATGSFETPEFSGGTDFLCSARDGHTASQAASGSVAGENITGGQYIDGFPPYHTWVFECVPDEACQQP